MLKWDKAPLSRIKEEQNRKLHDFINTQLYPFSPFYHKLFDDHKIDPRKIKTAADLRRLPFTSKKDLLAAPDNPAKFRDFILQPDEAKIKKHWPLSKLVPLAARKIFRGAGFVKEELGREYRPMFLIATTGRTAEPVSFLYSLYDIENLKTAGARLAGVFDIDPAQRGVNIFPYAPHLAFWQVAFAGLIKGALILSTGGGKIMGTHGNIAAISKIRPSFITGVPGYIYHLLRTAAQGKNDFSSVRKVILGAEKVPLGLKQKMMEMLAKMGAKNPKIIGTYGFTEARVAWGECPTDIGTSAGYHTYPDLGIFECINPQTGEVVGPGESGELVYTTIDGRGSCLLRYRTGDMAQGGIIYEPCPYCGRTVPRISSNLARASNILGVEFSKIKGTLVNLNIFAHLLDDQREVEEWQIEIRKKNDDPYEVDELIVYVCPKAGVEIEAFKEKLRDLFLAETEVTPNGIIVLSLPEILHRLGMETELKEKRFIDRRPKS